MRFTGRLLEFDKPNLNNRVYTEEAIIKAFSDECFEEKNKNNMIPVYNGDIIYKNGFELSPESLIGFGHANLIDGWGVDVEFDSWDPNNFESKFINPISLAGRVVEDKDKGITLIEDFELQGFSIDATTAFPSQTNKIIKIEETE